MDQESLIQKFLQNELSQEENKAFEELINEDPEFAQKVECCIILYADAKASFKFQIKTGVHAKQQLIDFMQDSNKHPLELITQKATDIMQFCQKALAKVHVGPIILRSQNFPQTGFDKAAQAFNEENYLQAITILEEVNEQLPDQNQVRFYLGLSHLYLAPPNYLKAALCLEEILDNQHNFYQEEAEWYLSLTYLKVGKIKEACQHLRNIFQNEAWNYKEAQTLLTNFQ